MSKGDGLFKHVLAELKVGPEAILHLGDNRIADQVASSVLGIASAHFRQFAADVEHRLRHEAAAASITDPDALDRFVTDQLERMPLDVLGRQLLLHGNEITPLAKGDGRRFRKGVLAPDLTCRILKRTAAYGARLAAHLTANGIAAGDAVMLVDLGYNGSVQNLIQPFLEAQLNLTVAGRYLLLREEWARGLDKAGLIDQRHYDTRMLHSLCGCVAVIEQLCTVAQGSVVDYAADGAPVRKDAGSAMACR